MKEICKDLFYRLSIIHVTLPPLRERKDEIPLLLAYYGNKAAEAQIVPDDAAKREGSLSDPGMELHLFSFHSSLSKPIHLKV